MILAALLAAAGAAPAPDAEAAARFGAREAVEGVSISPDGTHVAFVAPIAGTGSIVQVADIGEHASMAPIARSTGDPERITGCTWLTEQRLACRLLAYMMSDAMRLGFTRYMAVGSTGGNVKLLSAATNDRSLGAMQDGGDIIDWSGPADTGDKVLMTHQFVGENSTGTRLADDRRGLGVDAVDTATQARSRIEPSRPNAIEYISDGHGAVRIMGLRSDSAGGYMNNRISYLYRMAGSRDWRPLGTLVLGADGTGFNPVAVDRDRNVAYGFDRENGRQVLSRIALDGSLKREVVLARPDVDVDGLIRVGRQQRVVGVSYATDRRVAEYFDPELAALQKSLERALPGKQVEIVDASRDESKLVLFIGSDVDPGRYYLYAKATRRLEELLPARPQLEGVALSPVRAITYRAGDGTMIPAYLTLPVGSDGKGLPAIVLPHGGPSARDEWGFDWLSQFFAHQGYAVLQPQFRGSAGFGDSWFRKNGFQSWRTAVGDVNDAGRHLLSSGIAAPGKLAIFGWSYGGYAALQSPALDPALFKAIVAVAPVTDLETLRGESRDFTNFPLVDRFIGHGEHVRSGSPAQNVAAIAAPVLLFHGDVDNNVGVGESRLMAARLRAAGKKVDYVEFKGLDHYLADAAARTRLLGRADTFLRQALGL